MQEAAFITKAQLIKNGFRGLENEREYEIVERIGKDTVYSDSFIQPSFIVNNSGDQQIFYKIYGAPKYFAGLYSLYAIISAAKKIADREEKFESLEVIDETDYQEILIEYLHERGHLSGLDLISTIEEGRIKLAKKLKDDLLEEAKQYNLIDSIDLYL
ncbi:hypothetical protein M3182_08075 [Mesobacillus maritimus]|uniref:hypothetical protein n=1 Tax=Mesobacillus maritimus TaxID=1643336 RepID=UPI00203B7AD6|nr:hypothetical protein [Mesobacillus maritimus]MCM3585706.1 hypothetical protein [Mesobacillus maritimus]MCM3672034.1 hypothetical protein [Mesobacillus maritimus]